MSKYVFEEHCNQYKPSKHCVGSLNSLKEQFNINITSCDNEKLKFEIHNLPSDFHCTLRKLIINEVPSVAIDRLYLYNNTSCVEDSDLQLRIALTPVDVNPDLLEFYSSEYPNDDKSEFDSKSCLIFDLDVNYNKLKKIDTSRFEKFTDPLNKNAVEKFLPTYKERRDRTVYSDDLVWRPIGDQALKFSDVKLTEDVILNRLMPDEEIFLIGLAVKNYGHNHAKFIPVSAAHGRRAHTLKLLSPITGNSALTLQSLFPEGVIKIKKGVATVGDAKLIERTNKNFYEYEDLKDKVEIGLDENVFIWQVESVRPKHQPAAQILVSALRSMIEKCRFYLGNLEYITEQQRIEQGGNTNRKLDYKSYARQICGKTCFIEKDLNVGNGSAFYRFHGESDTLGVSLVYLMNYLFGGKRAACAYHRVELGIELLVRVSNGTTGEQILTEGFTAMLSYFQFITESVEMKLSSFHLNDVNME